MIRGSGECTTFRSGTNEANGLIFDKNGISTL